MSNTTETYTIKLTSSQFESKLDQIEAKMNHFESKLGGVGKTAAGIFGGGLMLNAFNKGIDLIKNTAFEVVKLGADFEQTKVSFETMLGSADKAAEVLVKLEKFAAITPFRFSEVVTGSKQLLAYGFEADSLTKNLTILGDVASGLSIPLGDLVYLYGTLKTQGKVMTKDLMQFAQRGIPIYDELAKVLGVSKKELGNFVTKGEVSFEAVEKAFQNMTSQGSKFGGLMEKQSKTLAGRWSTFLDKLEASGRELGTKLLPYLGEVLDKMSSIFESFKNIDFREWTDPLMQIYENIKSIHKSLNDIFNLDELGGQFLNGLRQLVKDVLLVATTLTATMEYVTKRAAAAGTSANWDRSMTDEQIDEFYKRNPGKELTFETALADKLQQAADTWSGKFDQATQSKAEKDGSKKSMFSEKSKAGLTAGKESSVGVEKVSSSTRNINISISELVHEITFSKTDSWRESEAQLIERIKRALLTAVNDVNIVAQ